MKVFKFFKVSFTVLVLALCGNAQADYLTSVKIITPGVAADKTSFRVRHLSRKGSPELLNLHSVRASDSTKLHLGLEETGLFAIEVRAEEFEPFEFKVYFARGHMQTVTVRLKRVGSAATATIERQTELIGHVFDQYGSVVPRAKVVAQHKGGRAYEVVTNQDGLFELTLPYDAFFWNEEKSKWEGDAAGPTRYELSVASPGFKVFRLENLTIVPGLRGRLTFDVILNLPEPAPGGLISKLHNRKVAKQ